MLDRDLAAVFDVPTKVLNQALRRNRDRFTRDFVFRLTSEESRSLSSQIVTAKPGRGGHRHAPWAFTEHGAIMAATLLRGWRAVELSVFVVRVFVRLRRGRGTEIAARLSALERKVTGHDEELKQM